MIFTPGSIIYNQYEILKKHNMGGIGKTYIAKELYSDHQVILKVLMFHDIDEWKTFDLFEREVKTLKHIKHPNIPKYINNFEIDQFENVYYFLVQDYVEGENLYDLVEQGKRFSYNEVLTIFKTLLEILDYLHKLHPAIIHRDIQPKNIILGNNNKVYLVDFGAVGQIAQSTCVAGNTFVGTIGYFPQEQLMGKIFPSTDLYALAMTMIFLLTGKNPSDLPNVRGKVQYHDQVKIASKFQKIIDKMIEPFPEDRFQSAEEVIREFNKNSYSQIPLDFETEPDSPPKGKTLNNKKNDSLAEKKQGTKLFFTTLGLMGILFIYFLKIKSITTPFGLLIITGTIISFLIAIKVNYSKKKEKKS